MEPRNEEGALVWYGTDPNASGGFTGLPAHHVLYCGRKVGPCKLKGVVDHTTDCQSGNNRCGPDKGCPCVACYNMLKRERAADFNRSGDKAWRGLKSTSRSKCPAPCNKLYYCGRIKNECRCGNCGGRCGPVDGCPCNDCLMLFYCKKSREDVAPDLRLRTNTLVKEERRNRLRHWADNSQSRVEDVLHDPEKALLQGCCSGNARLVQLLLDQGTNPNTRDSKHECTPLHVAARSGAVKIVRLLLLHGADPKSQTKDGCLPADLTDSKEIKFTLAVYAKRQQFDRLVQEILKNEMASQKELEQLATWMTTVNDFRLVFSVTNSLYKWERLSHEHGLRVLNKAFERITTGGLIFDEPEYVFVRFALKECKKRRWLRDRDYGRWKLRVAKHQPWVKDILKALEKQNARLVSCEAQLQQLQENVKTLTAAYRHIETNVRRMASETNSLCKAFIKEKKREEKVNGIKRVFSFISLATSMVIGDVISQAADIVLDLANPSDLLRALLDTNDRLEKLDEIKWDTAQFRPEVRGALLEASIQESDFKEMMRRAVVYQYPTLMLSPDTTRSRTKTSFADVVRKVSLLKKSATITSGNEIVFLGDLAAFGYLRAARLVRGDVAQFVQIAGALKKDGDDINAKIAVRLADGSGHQWSVLEYAVNQGYVDIVNHLLQREDVAVSPGKRGSIMMRAVEQQQMREKNKVHK